MKNLCKNPLSLAVILALTPTVASAATAMDSAESAAMEVISVTGKKVSYANNATQESDKHLKAPIGNVMDLINNLPGVNVSQGDAFGADDYTTSITMRGFVIDRADQQLGITIDGVPNGGSAYAGGSKANRYLDTENTMLVEVGQGAADIASASLDALGGTINFVSSNPESDAGAKFAHTQGSFDARRDYVRYDTGNIGNNTTAYVSLSDSYNKRWIGSGSNGYSDRLHFEAKSVTELDKSKYTARFSYDTTHEDNYQPVSLAHFEKTPRWDGLTNMWTGDPDIDQNFAETWSTLRDNALLYVKAEYELSDTLKLNVTPYAHQQSGRGDWLPPYQLYVTDAKGNRVNKGNLTKVQYFYVDAQNRPILDPKADLSKAKRVSSYRHTHYEKDRYGALADLSWALDSHTLRAGLWVEQQERNRTRDWHEVIDAKIYHHFNDKPYYVQFDEDYTTKVTKLYLQDQMEFGDLRFNVGLQKFLVDIERQDNLNNLGFDKIDSDSDVLPSAGLVYQLTNEAELFAGYSENFKAINDGLLESKKAKDLASLTPETAKNLEAGVRYNNGPLSLSATAYSVKFSDRIALLRYSLNADGTPNYLAAGDGNFDNIGGVDSNGFELGLNWTMTDTLSLQASLSQNSAEYNEDVYESKKLPNGKDGRVISYKSGQKVAGIPEQMASIGLNFAQDSYRAGINAKYTGEYFGAAKHTFVGSNDVWNRDEIPAYTNISFYAGYSKELTGQLVNSLDVNFVINNVTDKEHISGGSEGAYLIGAGRSAALTVSLGF